MMLKDLENVLPKAMNNECLQSDGCELCALLVCLSVNKTQGESYA